MEKNSWKTEKKSSVSKCTMNTQTKKNNGAIICTDISRGREKFEIPVYNEVDNSPAPLDFIYVTKPVSGGVKMTNNPNFLSCCSCTDNCRNPKTCECALLMDGFAYNHEKVLVSEKPSGIYECNQRCSCHVSRCRNRLVGLGPTLPLQVFRCSDRGKGWGLRCAVDIPPNTYVADYIGEVMLEHDAEKRGLSKTDEYLFTLDRWGRSQACQRLCDLGMKRGLLAVPAQLDVDVSTMSKECLSELLGEELVSELESHGALERARNPPPTEQPAVGLLKTKQKGRRVRPGETAPETVASSKSGGSWYEERREKRLKEWRSAQSVLTDRVMLEVEASNATCTTDARWLGGIGRFLNHSCGPNLDIVTVFAETQDIRTPRIAFFSNSHIPALTELCYDYGYFPGNVEGKHRRCLCGAAACRRVLY